MERITGLLNEVWAIEDTKVHGLIQAYTTIISGKTTTTFSENRKFLERAGCSFEEAVQYGDAKITGDGVAQISITGTMLKSDGWCSYGTATIANWIKEADANTDVNSIQVLFDSGGGMVNGTETLYNAILGTKKPIDAIVDGYCCSAAYWAASACDHIYTVGETSIFGSIGVVSTVVDYSKQLEAAGIKVTNVLAIGSEDKNAELEPDSKGNYPKLQKHLTEIRNVFVEQITAQRPEISKEVLTGKIFLASDAIKLGLVDGFYQKENKSKEGMAFEKIKAFFGGENITAETAQKAENELAELEATSAKYSAALAELETTKADLQTAKNELQSTAAALDAAKQELTATKAELTAKLNEANGKIAGFISGQSIDAEKDTNPSSELPSGEAALAAFIHEKLKG